MSITIGLRRIWRSRISVQIISIVIAIVVLIPGHMTSIRGQVPQPQLWGALRSGRYAVGFRTIYRFDPTHTWRITRAYEKPFTPDLNGRPIRVSVWYPATVKPGSRQMNYEDYIRTGKEKEFADLDKILERRDQLIAGLSVPPDRLADLMTTNVNAFKDAQPAAGRYPLVLHFAGLNDTSTINSFVLAEFLASHGYVVATVALLGETNEQTGQRRTSSDLARTISDMEFGWSLLRKEANVDEAKLAVTGHSLGGIEALLFAMRNANVSAVVGLDGTYGFAGDSVKVLTDFPDYAPRKMRAALLDLRRPDGDQGSTLDLGAEHAFYYSDRYFVTLKGMHHSDFTSFAMVAQEFHLGNSPGYVDQYNWTRETGYRGHQDVCRLVLDFLDEKLKGDSSGSRRLREDVARATEGVLKIEAGVPAPPSTNDLANLISTRGLEAATAIVDKYRRELPDERIVDQNVLNSVGYNLIAERKFSEAIKVLRFVVYAYPSSANAEDSLADAYIAAGQKDLARQALQEALKLLPADSSLDEESKKSMAKDEQAKLDRLKL